MARRRGPGPWQIDTGCTNGFAATRPSQQLGRAPQAERLDLLRAKRRNADLRNPERVASPLRISASAGHSSICQWFQSSGKPCTATTSTASRTPCCLGASGRNPDRSATSRRGPAAAWAIRRDRRAGQLTISRKRLQSGNDLKVPVRYVVRLVPEHDGFDHAPPAPLESGKLGAAASLRDQRRHRNTCVFRRATIPKPALRSIASTQARLGIHQLVGSPAYRCSMKNIRGNAGSLEDARSRTRSRRSTSPALVAAAQHPLKDQQVAATWSRIRSSASSG